MPPARCACEATGHAARLVVLTGGPGAGKTAVLEVVKRHFCEHITVLPESASMLFAGGFPRRAGEAAGRAAQRAIYHVQRELERMVIEERQVAVALCDRGTIDGLAYWPSAEQDFWSQLGTTREAELARYAAVIHLRTPDAHSYDHSNPVRTESPEQAARIDARIAGVWAAHPRRVVVASTIDFLDKVGQALALVSAEVPECCRHHAAEALAQESSKVAGPK